MTTILWQVSTIFSAYISQLLAQAGASPAAWKAKDAAMYLVITRPHTQRTATPCTFPACYWPLLLRR